MLYYRPVWTSGRYDRESHSAIVYNLLSGMSFYFEDISSDVIGYILSAGRSNEVDLNQICGNLDLDFDVAIDFFEILVEKGLLTTSPCCEESIKAERERQSIHRAYSKSTRISGPNELNLADAEKDYIQHSHSKVFSLLFELTYRCSEQCVHCYNPGATRNNDEVSYREMSSELELSDYIKIIDDFYNLGLIRVTLSGGDPFSKPIVWDIIDYLYQKEIVFDIYTNGLRLFGSENRLASYFPCTVGLSVYSDIPKVHDEITRVQGSYQKTISVISALSALAIPLSIKCCLMHQNCRSYRGVVKLADKYSASLQIDCNIFDSVDGDCCVSKSLRLSPDEMKIILRDKDLLVYVGPEIKDYGEKHLSPDKNICGAGYGSFCVTPDGKITLCPSFQSAIGDLRKDNVTDILNSSDLKWWHKVKFSDYKDCGNKDYCKFCAPCPGLNFSANGTPLIPSENNCYLAKMRKEVADLLKNGNDPLNGMSINEALSILPDASNSRVSRVLSKSHYKHRIIVD